MKTGAATGRFLQIKIFLKISQISQENTRVVISFSIKLQASLQHRCYPVKFAKFLRTPNLKNIYFCVNNYRYKCLSPFTGCKKGKAWLQTREKYMPVKRRQYLAETDRRSHNKEERLKKFFRQQRCILQ